MAVLNFKTETPIYHYTSVDAARIIAESGQLRFTRADQTNDPFEVQFVREKYLRQLSDLASRSGAGREKWRRILESYARVSDPKLFYIACFSYVRDSIAMWRLYSGEGSGVVLGFRPAALDAFDCRASEVSYRDEDGLVRGTAMQRFASSTADVQSTNIPINSQDDEIRLIVAMVERTVTTKLLHWDYEKEVRLSFSFDPGMYASIAESVDRMAHERLSKYRPTESSLGGSSYVFQNFGKRRAKLVDRSKAFAELVLGPNCAWTAAEAEEYLAGCGYVDFRVTRSPVAWR